MEESYVETVNSSTVVLFHCTLPSELSREIPSLCHPGIPGKFPGNSRDSAVGGAYPVMKFHDWISLNGVLQNVVFL